MGRHLLTLVFLGISMSCTSAWARPNRCALILTELLALRDFEREHGRLPRIDPNEHLRVEPRRAGDEHPEARFKNRDQSLVVEEGEPMDAIAALAKQGQLAQLMRTMGYYKIELRLDANHVVDLVPLVGNGGGDRWLVEQSSRMSRAHDTGYVVKNESDLFGSLPRGRQLTEETNLTVLTLFPEKLHALVEHTSSPLRLQLLAELWSDSPSPALSREALAELRVFFNTEPYAWIDMAALVKARRYPSVVRLFETWIAADLDLLYGVYYAVDQDVLFLTALEAQAKLETTREALSRMSDFASIKRFQLLEVE